MQQQNKILIVQIVILVLIIVFFFISKNSGEDSFKQAFKDANKRLDTINIELAKSRKVIEENNRQLDSIQKRVNVVKGQQAGSNTRVEDMDDELRKKIKTQEAIIKNLKGQYQQLQKEKDVLSQSLDSLASVIIKQDK